MECNNFFIVVKPLIIFCKIMGTLPYSYNGNNVHLTKYNTVHICLMILLYCTSLGGGTYAIIKNRKDIRVTKDFIQSIFAGLAQICITLLNVIVNKSRYMNLVQSILQNDREFDEINICLPYGKIKRRMHQFCAIRACLLIISFSSMAYYYNEEVSKALSLFLPLFFNSSVCYYLTIYVLRIRHGFGTLNSLLEEMVFTGTETVQKVPAPWTTVLTALNSICTIHHSLSKIIKDFNKTFGIVLLASFTVAFLTTVVSVHYIYWSLVQRNLFQFIGCASIAYIYVTDVIIICKMFDSTIEEVRYVVVGTYNISQRF